MVATAFQLGNHLSTNNYSFGLNAGIAGSFNREIDLGELVNVTEDKFCELGAEDGDRFMPIDELGFGESTIKPMQTNANLTLRHVTSVTVNTVHGNEGTIEALKNRIKADVESMEGASFFYGCNQRNLPSIQIRAISNYIEKRNRENWKIEQAVTNLNTFLIDFISKI
jgi:futalosine hydrolase